MKQSWRIPDFIDLEYFFAGDRQLVEEKGESVLRDRDRDLYLQTIGGEDAAEAPEREWLLYRWLQERRSGENKEQGGQALLPGRMWYELYGLFWSVFSFLAFVAGGGLCYSYLSYSGEQPVNVSLFFLVFVGGQVLFLLMLPVAWLLRKSRGRDLRSSLFLSLVNRALNRFLFRVRKAGLDHMGSMRKQQFAASLATVHARGKGYGTLPFWPLFLLFQLFGIAFNFGVLGALLVKVASSDLAFGWQSTIQLSSGLVATGVQWLALPWSWLLGASSYPDFAQVAGSRMILKDGFYHLANADLVSWWPFLCLAICCYCLLPRVLLFVFGTMARKRALATVSFARVEHNQLLHRLLTPRLHTQIQPAAEEVEQAGKSPRVGRAEDMSLPDEARERSPQSAVKASLLALVPDELFDDCDRAELAKYCELRFGYSVAETLRIDGQYAELDSLFAERGTEGRGRAVPLLILQEAWQPPILEMMSFFKELRENCEEETHIIVALIGKPTATTLFTPVEKQDLHIWQQKLALLADPFLQLAVLVEEL